MDTYILQIKQGNGLRIAVDKPIVVGGIKIRQRRDEIEFRDSNPYDQTNARRFDNIFNMCSALTLIFAVSLTKYWGKPPKLNKYVDSSYGSIKWYKDMEKLGSSKSTVLLGPQHIDRVLDYTNALSSLDTDTLAKVSEGISWYNKGLAEFELINKFILFYITLEFLGTYLNPGSPTAKVRKILNTYSDNKDITETIATIPVEPKLDRTPG